LGYKRNHECVQGNALGFGLRNQLNVKRTRYALDEAAARGREGAGNLIPELARDLQPGRQGIAPILNGLLRCGTIGPAAWKIGKENRVSTSFVFRKRVNLKRVLDSRLFHSATPSSTRRRNFLT